MPKIFKQDLQMVKKKKKSICVSNYNSTDNKTIIFKLTKINTCKTKKH